MTIEKFSYYDFEIRSHNVPGFGENNNKYIPGYYYVIYDSYYKPCEFTIIREADEYFDSEEEARLAAIGHISLLEDGDG